MVQNEGGSDPVTKNALTSYGYDGEGHLTQVVEPVGGTTGYQVDDLGNRVSESSPDSGRASYTFDADGNRLTKLDAKGQSFTYRYDALNRGPIKNVIKILYKFAQIRDRGHAAAVGET